LKGKGEEGTVTTEGTERHRGSQRKAEKDGIEGKHRFFSSSPSSSVFLCDLCGAFYPECSKALNHRGHRETQRFTEKGREEGVAAEIFASRGARNHRGHRETQRFTEKGREG
jgi:hypothetical protein